MSFRDEINLENPLGTKGEVVTQLAQLYFQMWNKACSYGYVNPSKFKKAFCNLSLAMEESSSSL